MQAQREREVRLPIGYTDAAGAVHRCAVLRKMRGHEEALLYDTTLSTPKLVTELLSRCLVQLDDLPAINAELITELYTADRNYLLLELRRMTLGDNLQVWYTCPRCVGEFTLMADLSQVTVRRLEPEQTFGDIELTLEDGYVDRQGTAHTQLTLTLPRGDDEEFVAPMIDKDPLKAQDALLLRCIKQFGTLRKAELEAYGIKILRDLTLGDRQRLLNAFNGEVPGVEFYHAITCPNCSMHFESNMDLANFFVLS